MVTEPRSAAEGVEKDLSECGGPDAALCSPAMPAAPNTDRSKAAGKAGEYKAVARPPHSEKKQAFFNALRCVRVIFSTHYFGLLIAPRNSTAPVWSSRIAQKNGRSTTIRKRA